MIVFVNKDLPFFAKMYQEIGKNRMFESFYNPRRNIVDIITNRTHMEFTIGGSSFGSVNFDNVGFSLPIERKYLASGIRDLRVE